MVVYQTQTKATCHAKPFLNRLLPLESKIYWMKVRKRFHGP
ncbi:MAG: hypothetical protein RLZ22_793, partial [Verrucomicrobiota bacterium]